MFTNNSKAERVIKHIIICWFLCLPTEIGLCYAFYGARRPTDFLMLSLAFVLSAVCTFFTLTVSSKLQDWIRGCVIVGVIFTALSMIKNSLEISRDAKNFIIILTEGSGNLPFLSIYNITDKSELWYFLSWTISKMFTVIIYILIYRFIVTKLFNNQFIYEDKKKGFISASILFITLCILNILATLIYKQDKGVPVISDYLLLMLFVAIPIILSLLVFVLFLLIVKKEHTLLHNQKGIVAVISLIVFTVIVIVGYISH